MKRLLIVIAMFLGSACSIRESSTTIPLQGPPAPNAADSVDFPPDVWTTDSCATDYDCEGQMSLGGCQHARCQVGRCVAIDEPVGTHCMLTQQIDRDCAVGRCVQAASGMECQVAPAPDGYPCGDFFAACGGAGKCVSAVCTDPCDLKPCNSGACTAQGCVYTPVDGGSCDDGNPCTTDDLCYAGSCGGTSICDCTKDADCEVVDDQDLCNGTLICKNNKCVVKPDSVVSCQASAFAPCESNVCNPLTGVCEPTPATDGTPCDDGLACTDVDKCEAGRCTDYALAVCELDCGDQLDDDGDGKIDCWDEDCTNDAACPWGCGDNVCQPWESCGNCPADCKCGCGQTCDSGACTFHGCDGKDCGLDGCGGSCGSCLADQTCLAGVCTHVTTCGDSVCETTYGETCATCASDCGCGCGEACQAGVCNVTACQDKECGDDGCGGDCGTCTGVSAVCVAGLCSCTPDCVGKNCGSDGCGGWCGAGCSGLNEECVDGVCECVPQCKDNQCGDDSCGGVCGTCIAGSICSGIVCEPTCGDGVCIPGESCAVCPGDCNACPLDFVPLQAGTYWIGSPSGCPGPEEYPGDCTAEVGRGATEVLHQVVLTNSFEVASTEITQAQWTTILGAAGSSWNPAQYASCGANCPVEAVSWFDALVWLNLLSKAEGKPPCFELGGIQCKDYTDAGPNELGCLNSARGGIRFAYVALTNGATSPYECTGYRLPTEAEWEVAARAGTFTATSAGPLVITGLHAAPVLDPIAWYAGNSGVSYLPAFNCSAWPERQYVADWCGPNSTAQKDANNWGLFDMAGNVWEWCWDWKDISGYGPQKALNPAGLANGTLRASRGGAWDTGPEYNRPAMRRWDPPGFRHGGHGFRAVRTLKP